MHGCVGQVEALALQKWGGQEGLNQEKQRRLVKRLEKAKNKAGALLPLVIYILTQALKTYGVFVLDMLEHQGKHGEV